ncbi:septum formation inhibitor Maf [Actinomyces johnsonii]|uniref:Nucleoside triphosphate pyrophosphatase n=1 Tax=Actinomyces johnsonii TaxID=544581 RepID=A0A508A4C7_9ACTO|nr:Maf family protein [Actinomyces johnsonii]KAA8741831.1 septum formation inhibitor Maf [Actinomyces johnsonii]TQD44789.1 septum formation inhibitor Maf [Actinomyces johnsonii]
MILLASRSSGRLSTLRAAGVEPLVRASSVDEEAVLHELANRRRATGLPAPSAAEQVQALARAKALDVAADIDPQEAEVVVGCDSMLEIDGRVVGKPTDAKDARERWRVMSGSTGTLYTGHFLVRTTDEAIAEGVSSATVHFGSPSRTEIEAYIASGEPLWCAGAFTIDGLGGAFIEGIDGDPHGVVGISLPLLRRLLADLGVRWTDLWAPPAGRETD